MRGNIRIILVFVKVKLLQSFRDKVALFFTFLFPLLFLLSLGFIFGGSKNISLKVALINNSKSGFSETFEKEAYNNLKVFKYDMNVKTLDEGRLKIKNDEISVIFELTENFGEINKENIPSGDIKIYYPKTKEEEGVIATTIMQGVLDSINKELGYENPPLMVSPEIIVEEGSSSFDYVFSGMVGMSLLGSTLLSLSFSLPAVKRTGALRRLRASSLKKSHLLISNAIVAIIFSFLSVVFMTIVAILVFKLNMRGSWTLAAFFTVVSAFMLAGLGLSVGGWAKNENQASPLANIMSFPMMILSGTFFPRYLMPEWLKGTTYYVPLTPVIDGFRKIITEDVGIIELLPQLGLIFSWTLVIYVIAIRIFRWD